MKSLNFILFITTTGLTLMGSEVAVAENLDPQIQRVPEEFESTGGHSVGFAQGGVAALSGVSAVRSNPALLAMERQYLLSAGYHWPTYGRPFYQLGVVDAQTSDIAAGVSYTGYQEKVEDRWLSNNRTSFDSPISKRFSVGFAKIFGKVTAGLQGTYISAVRGDGTLRTNNRVFRSHSGPTFGLGVAGLFTPQVRFGLSAENLGNKDFREVAPRIIRGGCAFLLGGGDFTAHIDLRHRERVPGFEAVAGESYYGLAQQTVAQTFVSDPELMAIGSFSARVYDLIRIMGGYGKALGADDLRSTIAGGVALVNNKFSLSYNLARPDMRESVTQTNLNINVSMNM